jgi:hypothetical protein
VKSILSMCTSIVMLLCGCSSAKVQDYEGKELTLDIKEYFNGKVEAWGVFLDRSNKMEPSFHADITGTWKTYG